EVRQAEEQTLLDLLEFTRFDHVIGRLFCIRKAEHFVPRTELWGGKRVDESNIVMDPSDLEDFLSTQTQLLVPFPLDLQVVAFVVLGAESPRVPALLDIAQEFDSDLVGVQTASARGHRSRVMVRVIDELRRT